MVHPSDADWLEFDEANEAHLATHQVRASELMEVFASSPLWARNKKGRTAAWLMVGRTRGGRPLVAMVIHDARRRSVRPVTARTCTVSEVRRWQI